MTQKQHSTLQLVTIHNGKLVINEQSAQIFAFSHNPIFVISACGQYRTGKSFLLNTLFKQHKAFDVSPTTQPCTQGINILKTPIVHPTSKYGNVNVWVMDSEGFGSMDKDSVYDSKIFLLILMLSDVLIYNSKGALDQETISRFALICQEAFSITQNINSIKTSINTKLCWVLRDFALTLQDSKGNQISPDQYLQQALSAHQGNADCQKAFLQRKIIKQIFKSRQCLPLVRPCISEQSLNSLHSIDQRASIADSINQQIRQQFIEGVQNLRQHILASLDAKKVRNTNGQNFVINGQFFIKMLKQFVNAINNSNFMGGLTVQWQQILQRQSEKLGQEIIQKINKIIEGISLPLTKIQSKSLRQKIVNETNEQLLKIHSQTIRSQTQRQIQCKINDFFDRNKDVIKKQLVDFIRGQTKQLEHKMMSLCTLTNFYQKIKGQFNKIRQNCLHRFQQFFISQTIEWDIKLQIERLLNKFYENLVCNLTKKWSDENGKYQLTLEQYKHKNYELTQQIKQINISTQHTNTKQLSKLRSKNEQMMRNMKNYNEVIDRMQSVNQSLKKELEILMVSQQSIRMEFEHQKNNLEDKLLDLDTAACQLREQNNILKLQLKECQDSKQILETSLTALKNKINEMENQYTEQIQKCQKQMLEKNQSMLQILQNERTKYQQLMSQWKNEQNELKAEIADRDKIIQKVRQQFCAANQSLSCQMEQIFNQAKMQAQKSISGKKEQFDEAIREKCILMEEIKKLKEQLNRKDEEIMLLENGIQIGKRELKVIQSQYKQMETDKSVQIKKLNEKLIHMQQEVKINEQKLILSSKQLSEVHEKYQKQIVNLTEKLGQMNKNHQQNSKSKEIFLKKQLQLQKSQIVSKLNEAAQRVEKLKTKNTVLSNDIEVYRQENNKLRQKFKQLESYNQDCEQCFRLQVELKQARQIMKQLRGKNSELKCEIQSKQNELLSVNKILQLRQEQYNTPQNDQCPQLFNTPKKRVLNQEYFDNFSRSPVVSNRKDNKLMEEQKEKLCSMFTKKEQKHQQVIQMYKNKLEKLIDANQKLKTHIEQQTIQLDTLSKQQRQAQKKKDQNNSSIQLQINNQEFGTDYDSLTSELKNKLSEITAENKRLRYCLQEERTKNDQLQRDSFKVANLHALMKKNRIEEVEQIVKENTELKYEIQKMKQRADLRINSDIDRKMEELVEANKKLKKQINEIQSKLGQSDRQNKQLLQKNQQCQELISIQKEELSKLIAHYEEKVSHLRISKEQNRTHLERQITLLKRQLSITKNQLAQLGLIHQKIISNKHQGISSHHQQQLYKTNETGLSQQKLGSIDNWKTNMAAKNYKDRLDKLFM